MGKSGQGFSFPRLIGWASLALGLAYLGSCVLTPPAMGDQLFLGLHWTGPLAWATTLAHAAFFFWLALVALRRRAVAVWGAIGYSVYLIENIWIYSVGEGSQALPSVRSMLIVNAVVTSILLTFCRVLLARRDEFDA
jgi:hypothetical protein